jgi:succinoglycan biosynthesis transport protein ExoP
MTEPEIIFGPLPKSARETVAPSVPAPPPSVPAPVAAAREAGTKSAPAPWQTKPTFSALLTAFKRRWLLALVTALPTMLGIATATWFIMPPGKFQGRTMLHVSAKSPSIAFQNAEAQNFLSFQRTQIALAKSRLVLGNALNQPKVGELAMIKEAVQNELDPLEWLEREVIVDFTVGPEILRIAVNGDHPGELTVLVNALREAYLQKIANREHTERLERLKQQERYLDQYQVDLRRKEQELRSLAKTLRTSDTKTGALRQQMTTELLATTQRELRKLEGDRRNLELRLADWESKLANFSDDQIPAELVEEFLDKDPQLEPFRLEAARLEKELAQVRLVAEGPLVEKHQKLVQAAEVKLQQARKEARVRVISRARDSARRQFQANVVAAKEQIDLLKKLAQEQREAVTQLENDVDGLSVRSVDLQMLAREVEQLEGMVKQLSTQREALRVELGAPSRVQVLEDAVVSKTYNEKKRIAVTGIAGVLAFSLVVFGFAWREFSARRVGSVEDVVHGMQLNLLGTMPVLPASARTGRLPQVTGPMPPWQHRLLESVDATRTVLLHSGQRSELRVVMVTSAVPGEGKTTLVCHLAASFARARLRTLIVDADLRNPGIHRSFNLPLSPGLSELLRDEVEISQVLQLTAAGEHLYGPSSRAEIHFPDVIQATDVKGLWVLPAGKLSGHAIQALASPNLGKVFQQLRAQYDVVLVDSAPVLPVTDAMLIGQQVDATIFAVMREVSRLPLIHTAHERLTQVGIRVLGTVVNGEPTTRNYESEYGYIAPVGK